MFISKDVFKNEYWRARQEECKADPGGCDKVRFVAEMCDVSSTPSNLSKTKKLPAGQNPD